MGLTDYLLHSGLGLGLGGLVVLLVFVVVVLAYNKVGTAPCQRKVTYLGYRSSSVGVATLRPKSRVTRSGVAAGEGCILAFRRADITENGLD
jgi:hypothetical protein